MPFTNLINEHKRLFRKPEIIGITVLFLLSAYYWIKNRPTDRKLMLIYTFTLIVLMGTINHNKTTKYAILLFPYFALLIAEYIYMLITEKSKTNGVIPKLFIAMLTFTIIFGTYANARLTIFGKEDWVSKHQAIASHIPKNSKVMAPIKFIFNEIGNYEIFGLLPARIILGERGKDFTPENLCNIADEYNVEYIIIDNEYRQQLDCVSNDTACLDYGQYKYLIGQGGFDIYKRDMDLIE